MNVSCHPELLRALGCQTDVITNSRTAVQFTKALKAENVYEIQANKENKLKDKN